MCDNCVAVVGEYKRQSYRLRVMLFVERCGYKSAGLNIQALQQIAEEFKDATPPTIVATHLCASPEQYGLEKRHENHPVSS